jgi:hypothetical protein
MVWHLGDDQHQGPILDSGVTFDADTLSTVLSGSGILPAAITQGTVNNTGVSTYTAYHEWETPLSALYTVMQTLGCHFRVMPDGTIDASKTDAVSDNPYVIEPTVVVVRQGWGSDPTHDGVPSKSLRTRRDARAYATEVHLIQERDDAPGYHSLVSADTQTTIGYKDIHNNTLDRGAIIDRPPSQNVELDNLISTELGQRVVEDEQTVETEQYEFVGSDFKVGDYLNIYDPPSGFTTAADVTPNEIWFRGQAIWPKKTRLLRASWPLAEGMGVYYRAADASYIDLTGEVAWEA